MKKNKMSLATFCAQKKYGECAANDPFIDPSECANLAEYLIKLSDWEGNPKDDPLEALVRFVQCVEAEIPAPASILSWMADTFAAYLKGYTSSTRATLDELFDLSGQKQLSNKYYPDRDELIAQKVAILVNWLHMPLSKACESVHQELNEAEYHEAEYIECPYLKTKIPDKPRIAQLYRKHDFKGMNDFPRLGTPEFDAPAMKVPREFLVKYLKSLPESAFIVIKDYLPSVNFLDRY